MSYIIAEPCLDVKDRACVNVCPVDCIREDGEADRMFYIDPQNCTDCGACEVECPVGAIFYEEDVPDRWRNFVPLTPFTLRTNKPSVLK